jgi:transposase
MLADRGYDGEWFRDALEQKGITPCIPGRKSTTTSADTNGAIASLSAGHGRPRARCSGILPAGVRFELPSRFNSAIATP